MKIFVHNGMGGAVEYGSAETIWGTYQDVSQSRKEIEAKAALFGCTAEFAQDDDIQLDLDTPEAVAKFEEAWSWAQSQLKSVLGENAQAMRSVSKSDHLHVRIKLPAGISSVERILIQALLGSDLRRELLNYTRLKVRSDDMTCLFLPKPKALPEAVVKGLLNG